jgi:hypothetical protein
MRWLTLRCREVEVKVYGVRGVARFGVSQY